MDADQPRPADHFAWLRTSMALQRTLLASVRTAVSLIGFGFTVAQFFQKGVISLGVASLQYSRVMKHLTTGDYGPLAGPHHRTMHGSTYFVALVVLLIGCVAFISVLARF
jgi:putative membrane protein